MSIFIDKETKVIVQGITGKQGSLHAQAMIDYGTKIVCGVTPGNGGSECLGVPVFNTVRQAKEESGATASVIFVPARFAADSIYEAIDAGIEICVCITEGIPVHDMMKIKKAVKDSEIILIGPNCPGIVTPGECKIGIIPGQICKPGHIGIISRSGTLTYEAINQLSKNGIGQSTAVGIGGDSIRGISFVECLELFWKDPETYACVLIGEIGGNDEELAAEWIKNHPDFPVIFYVSGVNAPAGKRMGHAGAIIEGGKGTAEMKIKILEQSGARNAITPDMIGRTVIKVMKEQNLLENCRQ